MEKEKTGEGNAAALCASILIKCTKGTFIYRERKVGEEYQQGLEKSKSRRFQHGLLLGKIEGGEGVKIKGQPFTGRTKRVANNSYSHKPFFKIPQNTKGRGGKMAGKSLPIPLGRDKKAAARGVGGINI